MGNTGRPSTGCSRCRKRRIKCDERKPGCFRCEKLGEECPGYTHGYWIFRDESDIARRRALKQSRSKDSDSPSNSPDDCFSSSAITENPTTSVIVSRHRVTSDSSQFQPLSVSQPSIFTDFEFRSVCLFMETFTLDPSTAGKYPAHLDFLPDMYMSPASDSSIHKAVKAISLTNFANRYGAKDLASTAWKAYGDALSATNEALRSPDRAMSDAVLAAVFLLGLNELICRPDMPLIGGIGWHSHVFGTLQLLRLRWAKKLKKRTELQLFQMVHTTVLIKCMMSYEPPPVESMGFVLAQDYPEGLGAKISTAFFVKVIDMRARLHEKGLAITLSSDEDVEEVDVLLDEAIVLLRSQSFENWTDNEPDWQVKRSTDEALARTDKISFSSQIFSQYWVEHWTVKVCLLKSILDGLLVSLVNKHDPEEISVIETKISSMKEILQEVVEDILGSIEYCLTGFYAKKCDPNSFFRYNRVAAVTSSVGALPMFWALGTVKHLIFADNMQKNIATAALKRIGTENSIAQALLHVF